MDHLSSKILMISPVKFRNNEHTLSDNVFQSIENKTDKIQFNSLKEFDKLRNVI